MEEEEEDQIYSWYVYVLVVKNGYRLSGCAVFTDMSKKFPINISPFFCKKELTPYLIHSWLSSFFTQ
jgi:hypothetical protein